MTAKTKTAGKRKAKSTKPASLREQLREAYLLAFDNFATDAGEVATALGIERAAATRLFKRLESKGIAASTHVNEERTLTWQAIPTYDNIDRPEAERLFSEAFPDDPAPSRTRTGGASGPRYSDTQIALGVKLTNEGKTSKEVAAAVGVKSPNYFRAVCRRQIALGEVERAKVTKPQKHRYREGERVQLIDVVDGCKSGREGEVVGENYEQGAQSYYVRLDGRKRPVRAHESQIKPVAKASTK